MCGESPAGPTPGSSSSRMKIVVKDGNSVTPTGGTAPTGCRVAKNDSVGSGTKSSIISTLAHSC